MRASSRTKNVSRTVATTLRFRRLKIWKLPIESFKHFDECLVIWRYYRAIVALTGRRDGRRNHVGATIAPCERKRDRRSNRRDMGCSNQTCLIFGDRWADDRRNPDRVNVQAIVGATIGAIMQIRTNHVAREVTNLIPTYPLCVNLLPKNKLDIIWFVSKHV